MAAKSKADAAPVVVPKSQYVPVYFGDKSIMHSGKLYFSEDGGPVPVHPDHLEDVKYILSGGGDDAAVDPTHPLAGATREELMLMVLQMQANKDTSATGTDEETDGADNQAIDLVAPPTITMP